MKQRLDLKARKSNRYVSVIGISIIPPLLSLLKDLEELQVSQPNEVQVSSSENGLAAGIVVLAITLLESALNRTRYLRNNGANPKSLIDFFPTVVPDHNLKMDLEEAVAVRDAIVHNHIWEARVTDVGGQLVFSEPPTLRPGYGDKRFRRILDEETRTSHRLRLNLFPSQIGRRDAHVVVKTVARALNALESKKVEYFPLGYNHFEFRGPHFTFYEIAEQLPD